MWKLKNPNKNLVFQFAVALMIQRNGPMNTKPDIPFGSNYTHRHTHTLYSNLNIIE
jgi:hypothetical protein